MFIREWVWLGGLGGVGDLAVEAWRKFMVVD
jgi:hypothetical protein